MASSSQTDKIYNFLKNNPTIKYTAKDLALYLFDNHKDVYKIKRSNKRFKDDESFISQLVAEIGSKKKSILKKSSYIFMQDAPRPRKFWYDKNNSESDLQYEELDNSVTISDNVSYTEHGLYPLLIDFLQSELGLYCHRIDEKTSKNSRGAGGNEWLHPDIVAMEAVDENWDDLTQACIKNSSGNNVRLWSLEVKIGLTSSNLRKSFFQAVSNSSWANEGYLVATSISGHKVEQEIRMLSALHGIGLIILNIANPTESEIMLPAKSKTEVDWESINRILEENSDFKDYIELVSSYYQTGRIRKRDWNK